MKIKDLADALGLSEEEIVDMLKKQDIIELNLRDKYVKEDKDSGKLEVL